MLLLFVLLINYYSCLPFPFHALSPGNIYTGSPKHVNLVPYQATSTYNSYNSPAPPPPTHQGDTNNNNFHHPLQSQSHQMMFHPPPNLLMDTGTPFGTPTKKFILAEMPIEYSQQQMGNNNTNHHQQQQQQQLQDAVTNVSPSMFQTNFHNNAMANNNMGNCVILLNTNSPHPVVAMHSKSRTLLS